MPVGLIRVRRNQTASRAGAEPRSSEGSAASAFQSSRPTPAQHRCVTVYSCNAGAYASRHETQTRIKIAQGIAALKGCDFAARCDLDAAKIYFVPSDALETELAAKLGIGCEDDLFGGVVPYPFVGTKVITHPLIEPEADAPRGWTDDFGRRVDGVVLRGFSVFTRKDARRAAACLLERGPLRVKRVRATAGLGQTVVAQISQLDAVLDTIEAGELATDGLVLEENLNQVKTYSVGEVRVADLQAVYVGSQRLTSNRHGVSVYGGSDLVVARDGFAALDKLSLPEAARLALAQARAYDAAAQVFSGFFASRRNYDVAQGFDSSGTWRSGVLEQSWRMGGASSAEIGALQLFRANPALAAVRASCFEIYDMIEPPPGATIFYRGTDDRTGPMTKYTLVEPYDDP